MFWKRGLGLHECGFKMSYHPSFDGDGGQGGGGGTGDGGEGGGDGKPPEGFISKADHEKAVGDLKQMIEDSRMEMLTPEYLAFLQAGKGGTPKKEEEKKEEVDFSKMSPAQIAEHFDKKTKAEIEAAKAEIRGEFHSSSKESIQKEVAAFARTHSDYEKYRPLMHGLATDPKNKDLSLEELYNKSKEYAKGYGPTEDEKSKGRKAMGEKPGGGSGTNGKKDAPVSAEAAAEATWQELGLDTEGLPKA